MTGDVVLPFGKSAMAEGRRGDDVVSEFLQQNPHLAQWVESLAGESETEKQWRARREFILRNMEGFPTIQPGSPSPSLDRLISLSMVWANHIFLGCRYPQPVMDKITEMAEGIAVQNAPTHKTRDEIMGMSKDASKKPKPGVGYRAKTGPTLQAPKEHQPFFNRLYKAIAWKLVSAGGFGPNIDHFEILRTCVESAKASLGCVFVPLKDIPDLPAGRAQQGGLVCELRCQTVYLGTGYGRGEDSARAMAAKEALKLFQSRKVTVKIFRRKYSGRDVEDLVLHDDQMRNSSFPPALSYPFDPE